MDDFLENGHVRTVLRDVDKLFKCYNSLFKCLILDIDDTRYSIKTNYSRIETSVRVTDHNSQY